MDFAIQSPDGGRERVNIFRQQGKLACTIRLLNDRIPTIEELQLPPILKQLADEPRGLILVTGPTGSGKSTTLAAMIDYVNASRPEHIITIEDLLCVPCNAFSEGIAQSKDALPVFSSDGKSHGSQFFYKIIKVIDQLHS